MNKLAPGLYHPTWTDRRTKEKKTATTIWVRWYCRGLCGNPQCGGLHRENSNTTIERDAKRFLADKRSAVNKGKPVTVNVERTGFEDLATLIVDEYKANGRKSLRRLQGAITHLRNAFGRFKAAQITTAALTTYTNNRLAAGAKPATIRNEQSAIKRMFRLAHLSGAVGTMPHVPMVEVHNTREGFFTQDEYEKVLSGLPEDLVPLVSFLWFAGWRVNEAMTLTWDRVDFQAQEIRLSAGHSKNKRQRVLPFGAYPQLATVIYQQAKRRVEGSPYIFHRDGRPIRNFRCSWRTATKAAGCAGRLVHDLRRSAVRNMVAAGISEALAMRLTGHVTRSIFERYNISTVADLSQATAKLAALHGTTGQVTDKSAQFSDPLDREIAQLR